MPAPDDIGQNNMGRMEDSDRVDWDRLSKELLKIRSQAQNLSADLQENKLPNLRMPPDELKILLDYKLKSEAQSTKSSRAKWSQIISAALSVTAVCLAVLTGIEGNGFSLDWPILVAWGVGGVGVSFMGKIIDHV